MYSEIVRELIPLIRESDRYGALHIVVDDWNLEDENIASCEADPSVPLTSTDRDIIRLMKLASTDERFSAMAFADGYAAPDGSQ